jgi:hydrogenase expression/formation protein HypC
MCIGIPMQVEQVGPGFAICYGRGQRRRLSTLLVEQPQIGDWLLSFLDDAREQLDATRAAEINAVLDLLDGALAGNGGAGTADFVLPSSMSAAELNASLHAGATTLNQEPT